MGGENKSLYRLNDVSYYYSAAPDFVTESGFPFPSIGPYATGFPTPTNDIPARNRNDKTYLPDPTEFPSSTTFVLQGGDASFTKVQEDVIKYFVNGPFINDFQDFDIDEYESGNYVVDTYLLQADVLFCPQYSSTPESWLSHTGYKTGSDRLLGIHINNPTSYSVNLVTYFYFVESQNGGEDINKWAPYDPYSVPFEWFALGNPGASTTSGSLTHDEAWCNTHTLTGNVTIPSGITLKIKPGTVVYIPPGKRITVQGTLIAEGTSSEPITFDKSGSSKWWGIKFEDSSDDENCILEHCNIQNASYGAYCYNASPAIIYCNINNNTTGIYKAYGTTQQHIFDNDIGYNSLGGVSLTNAASSINVSFYDNDVHHSSYVNFNCFNITIGPDMYGNKIRNSSYNGMNLYSATAYLDSNFIYDNNGYGIYCNNSSPELSSYKPGKNVVAYNGSYGIYGDANSQPLLGNPAPNGQNSYYGNNTYDVYSLYTGWIYAKNCFWGADQTPYIYTAGTIWYAPILTSDPNDDPHELQKAVASSSESNNPEETENYQVNEDARHHYNLGYELELKGNYDAALERYKYVITNHTQSLEAEMSLIRILNCYHKTNRSEVALSYMETLVTEKADFRVGGKALGHLTRQLVQDGEYKKALTNCQSQAQKFADSDISKDALFTKWQIYFDGLKEEANARSAMNEFEASFPNDYLLAHIKIAMGEWNAEMAEKFLENLPKRSDEQPEQAVPVEIPDKFTLSGNYPNPFNPETRIKFGLPEESRVTIDIFNVLGQQVKRLLESEKAAGYHSVRWDGTDQFGKKVGAGVYLYRMQAGDFIKTQKMMLLP